MKKDLIVAIFAPTTSRSTRSGSVGTGYPVTEDLILTSRHVVEPEHRNRRKQIEIRWFHDKPANGRTPSWIPINNDALVWTGQGDLDAALIRCPRPEYLRKFSLGRLTERRPGDSEHWQSVGFARANKRDDVREPGDFGGTLRSMAEGNSFFEVLEDAKPITEEQWQGVSGMPVFVGSEILGVVKRVPGNYEGKKLQAVPIWRLLQDQGFVKALGWDEARERLERARKLLRGLLEGSDQVTRELATALELSCDDNCRVQVVEKLLTETPSLERLFELALTIQTKQRGKKDQMGARVAAKLMLIILPAIYDAVVVSEVRRCKGDVTVCPLALPTKLRTLAEIIMAGADRRAALLRTPATRLVFPEGEACLPEPPECGRDADGKQFDRDWRAHLLEIFGTDDHTSFNQTGFKNAFQDYLKERFIQSDLRSADANISEQELLDTVAVQLRQEAENQNNALTYYFIARMPENQEARQQREAVLAELKRSFPPIAFLRLAGNERLDIEVDRYGKLRNLLYEDPEADK